MEESPSFQRQGAFRELVSLFAPILLITFSNFIFLLIEKLLLARLSVQAMEAAVNAAYVLQIFQGATVILAMMAQVFVGRWLGAKAFSTIGPGIWQFIWFSVLSTFLVVPLNIIYGSYYFSHTAIEQVIWPYFLLLSFLSFLFPLGATLTCFNLGQGKTKLILYATIGSQLLKLSLAYLLIFGWEGIFPAFGLIGGAISTGIAQGLFCTVLFKNFLNGEYKNRFNTHQWNFKPKLFWESIRLGGLRALTRVSSFICWASIAHLMSIKGGDYLLVLSIGGTLFLFLPFLGDAICQAQTTIFSQLLGANQHQRLNSSSFAAVSLVLIMVGVVGIPLCLFPLQTFAYLFPTIALDAELVKQVFFGIWVSFAFFTFAYIPISFILASKDMVFSFFMGAFGWINGYLLMYIAIDHVKIGAPQFWLVLALMHSSNAALYFWRMKWLRSRLSLQEIQA